MAKTMGVAMGLLGVVILMMFFPLVMTATNDLQTDTQADTFAAVTTGVGETDADVVLTMDLFNDTVTHIVSITSNNSNDTPVAGTYTAATNTLNITGLHASDTRTLVVTYDIDALTDYTGMGSIVGITPLLIWIGIMAIVLAGTWFTIKGKG